MGEVSQYWSVQLRHVSHSWIYARSLARRVGGGIYGRTLLLSQPTRPDGEP